MIVFDAEPLVAFYGDEPGSDVVASHVRAVESGERPGALNAVTCTEVHYVTHRDDPARAGEFLERVRTWLRVVEADDVWAEASKYKAELGVPLGDAFTLATAEALDGTALVGADGDFDEVTDVDVERFRNDPA